MLEISTLSAIFHSKIRMNFRAVFRNFGWSVSNFRRAVRFFDSMVFNVRQVVLFRRLFKQCFIAFSTTIDGCVTAHFQVERSLGTASTDVTQFVLSRVYAGGFHNSPACLANLNTRKILPRMGIKSSLDTFAIAGCKRQ